MNLQGHCAAYKKCWILSSFLRKAPRPMEMKMEEGFIAWTQGTALGLKHKRLPRSSAMNKNSISYCGAEHPSNSTGAIQDHIGLPRLFTS